MLKGPSVARTTRLKPAPFSTFVRAASPAWAPRASPTSWASDVGTQIIVEATDRIAEVVARMVGCDRLDQHPRPVGLQQRLHMRRAAARVAHVVQAVEHRDQVEVPLGYLLRRH